MQSYHRKIGVDICLTLSFGFGFDFVLIGVSFTLFLCFFCNFENLSLTLIKKSQASKCIVMECSQTHHHSSLRSRAG
jgi:hypothetical protein